MVYHGLEIRVTLWVAGRALEARRGSSDCGSDDEAVRPFAQDDNFVQWPECLRQAVAEGVRPWTGRGAGRRAEPRSCSLERSGWGIMPRTIAAFGKDPGDVFERAVGVVLGFGGAVDGGVAEGRRDPGWLS